MDCGMTRKMIYTSGLTEIGVILGLSACATLAVTPVHKGAGRKRVAIDPPEAVVQGRQRVVPLQPELW